MGNGQGNPPTFRRQRVPCSRTLGHLEEKLLQSDRYSRMDRSGNVFLHSKCTPLRAVATEPLFYLFSTACVGRGSKAAAVRSDPVPGQPCLWWGPCTDARWWDTAAPWQGTRSRPTRAGPCGTFPQRVRCKVSVLLLQRETSDSPNWVGLACKLHHLPCVYGAGGTTLQLY